MSVRTFDMLLYIADENAREVKVPYQRRREQPRSMEGSVLTEAFKEEQEWAAFKATVDRRKRLFGELSNDAHDSLMDMDEDDIDALIMLIGILDRARLSGKALTLAEVVRGLQRNKILTVEFTAAARARTQWMLEKLRVLKRVQVNTNGLWSLV